MRLPRLLAGGAVLALLTGTAACGAQALEPRVALRDAFGEFAAKRAGAVELSIASSADEVLAFAGAAEPGTDPGISDDDLDTLLASSLDLAYDLGEDREDATDDAASVLVRIDDLVAGEMRALGEVAYVQADLDGLAERFPGMQQGLDEFRSSLTGEDGVSEPAPEEIREPAAAFLEGEWISIDTGAYLEQLQGLAAAEGAGTPGLSDDATQKIRDALGAALKDAVTSVERRESDDVGDHLVAQVDLRKVYTALRDELPGLYDDATAEALEQQLPPVSEVPDKQIDVSFWLRDGELQRAELDFAQFLDEPAGSLVLRADLGSERDVTAPEDAVEFDLGALMEMGLPGMAASGALGSATPPDAHLIATMLDMDIASLAFDQGGQPSVAYLPEVLPYYEGVAPDLAITAVGERVQVALGPDVVCLMPSPDGTGAGIVAGPC